MTIQERPLKYAETVGDIVKDRDCLTFSTKTTVPEMIEKMHAHGVGGGGCG